MRILINNSLDNNYSFSNINQNNGHKEFDKFIKNTVGKGQTISQVDKLYKRTKGPKEKITIQGQDYEYIHYGQDRSAFRIFGYYDKGYFVIKKIDTNHKTHK